MRTRQSAKVSSEFLREDASFLPEGVETLVTGLGPLGGDGQQVRGAAALDAAWREEEESEGGASGGTNDM